MTIKNTPERYAECRALETDYLNNLWPSDGAPGKLEGVRLFAIADTICEIKEIFAEREDGEEFAEAAVMLTRRLERVFSAEERMRVAVQNDPLGYLRYLADLLKQAKRAGYISTDDLELKEAMEVIEHL